MADVFSPAQGGGISPLDLFQHRIAECKPSPVLEMGTLQSVRGVSTHHISLFPYIARRDFVMGDIAAGPDVDEVCDLHTLPAHWRGRFQAFLAVDLFEHLERPWIAAKQIFDVLAPGGLCYVSTHQCFPLHGYPGDFFRFSREGLMLLFRDAGFDIVAARYEDRCRIVPPAHVLPSDKVEAWNASFPSYVGVHLLAEKSGALAPAVQPPAFGDPLSLVRRQR